MKKASCKKIQELVLSFKIKFKNTPNNNMHYLCIHVYVVEENNLKGKDIYILDQGGITQREGKEGTLMADFICACMFYVLKSQTIKRHIK